jgi:CRISPR-associated protein Cas1
LAKNRVSVLAPAETRLAKNRVSARHCQKNRVSNGGKMFSLYVSQQGCYVCLVGETLAVKRKEEVFARVPLPLVEQILILGKSQVTTQVIRTCLWRDIPIAYLSRMGFCYGRILPIARGYRYLSRYQQGLSEVDRLLVARKIVEGKLRNSRALLQRQRRYQSREDLTAAIDGLGRLMGLAGGAENRQQLMGYEGAGAREYFSAFGDCFSNGDFVFAGRSRRPPGNPVNAMLSFGYQILWNHLLSSIEIQGLDPYYACLHEANEGHAALASDLIEEFRAPIIDSLVLWLINSRAMDAREDFVYRDGGCFLNDGGRRKFLTYFVGRMEEVVKTQSGQRQPRWDLLTQQVKVFKQFVYQPVDVYRPYAIR